MNHSQRARRASRGFTLVELLIVVAMIGILASLAILGYRRYLNAAHSSEAKAVISMIRNGEEGYKAEMLQYLQASKQLTSWYPQDPATTKGKPSAWVNGGHADAAEWKMLNINPDGPVRFGYVCRAGIGTTLEAPNVFSTAVTAPTLPSGTAWYMVQAKGDNDGNGKYAVFAATSLSGEIMSENEQE